MGHEKTLSLCMNLLTKHFRLSLAFYPEHSNALSDSSELSRNLTFLIFQDTDLAGLTIVGERSKISTLLYS